MEIKKFEFIKELLENRKLKPYQREQILRLTAKEIDCCDEIEERITKIEARLSNEFETAPSDRSKILDLETESESIFQKEEVYKSPSRKYFNPKYTYEFLLKYNQNPVLRSTCHDIDSDAIKEINEYCETTKYSFKTHRDQIITSWNSHQTSLAPYQIKNLISVYLTGKSWKQKSVEGGWSSENIKWNWAHPDIEEWSIKNQGIPPNLSEAMADQIDNLGFQVEPFISELTGSLIQDFRDIVYHFKDLFHIRPDNSLRRLIELCNARSIWRNKVNLIIDENEFPQNIDFFMDVDKVIQGYTRIIDLCINNHQGSDVPVIKTSLIHERDSLQLSIKHINNKYRKDLNSVCERPLGNHYNHLIMHQANGNYNVILNADFGQKTFARIDIWTKNVAHHTKREPIILNTFEGVEHIFEFPKN